LRTTQADTRAGGFFLSQLRQLKLHIFKRHQAGYASMYRPMEGRRQRKGYVIPIHSFDSAWSAQGSCTKALCSSTPQRAAATKGHVRLFSPLMGQWYLRHQPRRDIARLPIFCYFSYIPLDGPLSPSLRLPSHSSSSFPRHRHPLENTPTL